MWNILSSHSIVCLEPHGGAVAGPRPLALLPGSFDPLHHGHTALAAIAAARLGVEVHFELSITNADKPELPRELVEQRVAQFAGVAPIWLTRAATFEAKAALFPGAVFVLGWDTATRVIDPKYYGSEAARDRSLRELMSRGCRLVVGGRLDPAGVFRLWDGNGLPSEFGALFIPLTEANFRVDVSSSSLREKARG